MLSQGIPMLLAGDEMGQTQNGNNNAYCQDSEISWLNWDLSKEQSGLLEFTERLIAFWHRQPVLQQRRFFHGREIHGETIKDVMWFDPSGKEMSPEAWNTGYARSLGLLLRGDNIDIDEYGAAISGDTLLILFNADHALDISFTLPKLDKTHYWELAFDTFAPEWGPRKPGRRGRIFPLRACSLAAFRAMPIARNGSTRREAIAAAAALPTPTSDAAVGS